jgi:hypothetical protein
MLVVMSIAAILGTLTVASMVSISRRSAREGAAQDVANILRQARLSAVDTGRGSVVRINAQEHSLHGIARKVLAAWHLEGTYDEGAPAVRKTPGARSMNGLVVNAPTIVQGTVGLCFNFNPVPGTNQYVDCGSVPIYNQTDGIRLEAYVWPEGAATGNRLGVISKTDGTSGVALWLRCDNDQGAGTYSAHGSMAIGTGAILLDTASGLLPGNAWSHVALEYDGFEGRLLVNGVLGDMDSWENPEPAGRDPNPVTVGIGFTPGARMVPATGRPLEIGRYYDGAAYDYFRGRIDEPQVLSVAGGSHMDLPARVPLAWSDGLPFDPAKPQDAAVYFDGQGNLDLAYHTGPVFVAVGDPFQATLLDSDNGATVLLRGTNPFPPNGGMVLIGAELVDYTGAVGLTLNTPGRVARYAAGDPVYFARAVRIEQTGIVERVERKQ